MNSFECALPDPWCPGCGHHTLVKELQSALSRHFEPHRTVLVTDIGCIGMADNQFTCHTVHGLHGRSPALASAIAMTGREGFKIVALMGDGGASIGLSHILEAARLNVDMTLIISNNQNYGMTGGQHSAYTLPGIVTATTDAGYDGRPFDIISLAATLGVMRARTSTGSSGLGLVLERSLLHRGFSVVEVLSLCTTYSAKMNRETLSPAGLEDSFGSAGLSSGLHEASPGMKPFVFSPEVRHPNLKSIEVKYVSPLKQPVRIMLAGSAGQGIQSSAGLFCSAAVISGLEVDMCGDYPVTVGKGFSAASMALSPDVDGLSSSADYTTVLITSQDGYSYCRSFIGGRAAVVLERSLEGEVSIPGCSFAGFSLHGRRNTGFAAIAWLASNSSILASEALHEMVAALPAGARRESLMRIVSESL